MSYTKQLERVLVSDTLRETFKMQLENSNLVFERKLAFDDEGEPEYLMFNHRDKIVYNLEIDYYAARANFLNNG